LIARQVLEIGAVVGLDSSCGRIITEDRRILETNADFRCRQNFAFSIPAIAEELEKAITTEARRAAARDPAETIKVSTSWGHPRAVYTF